MAPLVSVVIPTRDRLPLLAQTLHTVLSQSIDDLDVVVVDEASTDGTAEWLASHTDGRLRTVRHDTPRGLPAARNAGIETATGRWIAFVDDDDLWSPDKLELQLGAAEREGAGWAFGSAVDFTDGPQLLRVTNPSPEDVGRLPWANTVPGGGSNVVLLRELLDTVGVFDTSLPTCEDWDLWIRLVQEGQPAIVQLPVVAYRIHPGNMSRSIDGMLNGIAEIDRRYRDARDGADLDWQGAYRWLAAGALRSGDWSSARRITFAAVRAGHVGARRRFARSLLPIAPRTPGAEAARARTRWMRAGPSVAWPPGTEQWIRQALAVVPR